MVFLGVALPVKHGHLEVSPLGLAVAGPPRAAEEAELGCGEPGAPYGSTNALGVLLYVTQHPQAA